MKNPDILQITISNIKVCFLRYIRVTWVYDNVRIERKKTTVQLITINDEEICLATYVY